MVKITLLFKGDKIIPLEYLDQEEEQQLEVILADMIISKDSTPCG